MFLIQLRLGMGPNRSGGPLVSAVSPFSRKLNSAIQIGCQMTLFEAQIMRLLSLVQKSQARIVAVTTNDAPLCRATCLHAVAQK